jgi:hypothetical protein
MKHEDFIKLCARKVAEMDVYSKDINIPLAEDGTQITTRIR